VHLRSTCSRYWSDRFALIEPVFGDSLPPVIEFSSWPGAEVKGSADVRSHRLAAARGSTSPATHLGHNTAFSLCAVDDRNRREPADGRGGSTSSKVAAGYDVR
jgi:hypothetical protein